jgi:hypothetical protein
MTEPLPRRVEEVAQPVAAGRSQVVRTIGFALWAPSRPLSGDGDRVGTLLARGRGETNDDLRRDSDTRAERR